MNICGILNLPVRKREDRGLAVWGPFSKEMDYWCNPANLYRHARLRSVRSDRRAWSFHDYDAQGRETARLEQLDGSPFSDGLAEVSHLAELPEGCSAKATVTSYEPPEGGSRDRNDAFLPRQRETWVMRTGKAPFLVGAETWLYTRASDAQGVALRTYVHASGAGETLRTETTVEYPEDCYAVPKELRGRTVSRTEADGATEKSLVEAGTWDACARAFTPGTGGAYLRTTTRRAGGGVERDTYDVSVEDALRRLTVPIGEAALSPLQIGSVTDSLTTYDPATGIETETITSSTGPTIVRRSLHGVLLSTETSGETTVNSYDAFARVAQTWRAAVSAATGTTDVPPAQDGGVRGAPALPGNVGEAALSPLQAFTYSPTADLGDTTTWTHDPYSGNCLSKTYADGSSVTYTYTPDNLLLRTTYASGKWKKNVYDSKRRLCGVVYSSPDMDYQLQLDEYGSFATETAADAQERVPPRAAETAAPHKIARPRRRSATPARATPNHRLPPTALRPIRPNPKWSRTSLSCIQTL